MTKPILVFGYGNPSRGDDAVGPLLLEHLQQQIDLTEIELQTDFQLQIEHTLDLQDRKLVMFVDASVGCRKQFAMTKLEPTRDNSYSSHAMSPGALLEAYRTVTGRMPPPSYLLSIQTEAFELGEPVNDNTLENLNQACLFAERLLGQPLTNITTMLDDFSVEPI